MRDFHLSENDCKLINIALNFLSLWNRDFSPHEIEYIKTLAKEFEK